MRRAFVLIVVSLCVAGCHHERTSWQSHPAKPSPYKATLTEDSYNYGDTNQFSLRIDAAAGKGGEGYFFTGPLDAGGAMSSPRPQLIWTSPTDLLVTVHTAELEGQTVRQLGDFGQPRGSLTIRYVADAPSD